MNTEVVEVTNPKLTSTRPSPPRDLIRGLTRQSIDINVIQPTPNISPTASLRSFDDGIVATNNVTKCDNVSEHLIKSHTTSTNVEVAETSTSTTELRSKSTRRVSFSEDEGASSTSVLEEAASVTSVTSKGSSRRGSLATSLRQMTVPMAANTTMSYLQVRKFYAIE